MLVFLIGYMGSGKSYVGKKVAEKLGFDFIDLDELIAKNEKMNISTLFERFGEEEFRKKEQFYLKSLFGKENTIVATGGGTPCFFDNMEWMNENGITIYLFAKTKLLFQRLQMEMQERPMLKNISDDLLEDYIQEKVNERAKFYDQAEVFFEIKNNDDSIVEEIVHFLNLSSF